MEKMTLQKALQLKEVCGLVCVINDGIITSLVYEGGVDMLTILTQMIRDTREQLQPIYGTEMTEEIILACYRDSLKAREVEEKEKIELSKALLKGASKYLTD